MTPVLRHLTSCFIQKWPKINSTRVVDQSLDFFRKSKSPNFWKIKFSFKIVSFWVLKMCLNWILKEFGHFYVTLGGFIFSQIFGLFEIQEFSKIHKNSKIIKSFWSVEFLDHLLFGQLFKNFIFRFKNVQRIIKLDLKDGKCRIGITV